jgi:hypothetical protein
MDRLKTLEGIPTPEIEGPTDEAVLLEQALRESGIDSGDLQIPEKIPAITERLNDEVETLARTHPASSLNELLRRGRKLGLPIITAAAILIGAGCMKEKSDSQSENGPNRELTIKDAEKLIMSLERVGTVVFKDLEKLGHEARKGDVVEVETINTDLPIKYKATTMTSLRGGEKLDLCKLPDGQYVVMPFSE